MLKNSISSKLPFKSHQEKFYHVIQLATSLKLIFLFQFSSIFFTEKIQEKKNIRAIEKEQIYSLFMRFSILLLALNKNQHK